MPRLMSIDYGRKRVGLAVTDPSQLVATPLITVAEHQLMDFLTHYLSQEEVEGFVLGWPIDLKGETNEMTREVERLEKRLNQAFPHQRCFRYDERFTSKLALQSMVLGGFKVKERRKRGSLDSRSATLLLQSFLIQRQRSVRDSSAL